MMGVHLKGKCQKLKSSKKKRYLSLSAMMISICHIHISAVSHLSNSSKHQQQEQSSAHHTKLNPSTNILSVYPNLLLMTSKGFSQTLIMG